MPIHSLYDMKILLVLIVIFAFGLVGYIYKQKLKNELDFFKFINEFEEYYNSNMTLFKCDIIEIIDKFIIMQNNKNAKYINLFLKNNNLYAINKDFISKQITNKESLETIYKYLTLCGKSEYDFEKEKNENFKAYINNSIIDSEKLYKEKGGLVFKLLLAIGSVIGILIW